MIIEFLENDYSTITLVLLIVSFTWIAVACAIVVDLFFGINKARQLGEMRTSEGFRRTINKATYYYALMFFALIFDSFNVVTPYFFPKPFNIIPYFSVLVMIGLAWTEAKSVREKAEDKLRRKADNSFKEVIKLISERQDVMNQLVEILRQEKEKQNEQQEHKNASSVMADDSVTNDTSQ